MPVLKPIASTSIADFSAAVGIFSSSTLGSNVSNNDKFEPAIFTLSTKSLFIFNSSFLLGASRSKVPALIKFSTASALSKLLSIFQRKSVIDLIGRLISKICFNKSLLNPRIAFKPTKIFPFSNEKSALLFSISGGKILIPAS